MIRFRSLLKKKKMQFFLGAQRTTTTFGDIHQECGVGVETASSHVAAAAAETRKCQKESTTEKWEYFSCGFCVLKERARECYECVCGKVKKYCI